MALSEFSVKLKKIIEMFQLEGVFLSDDIDTLSVNSTDINRPGLQLTGFFDYFDTTRLQLIGKVECSYLEKLPRVERIEILNKLFSYDFPALIITRGIQLLPDLVDVAREHNKTLLRTEMASSEFMSALNRYLNVELAPRKTRHGVLVEVYGEGVLILGESGVGKSECAIELVKRGHRLVADDAVEIKRVSDRTLVGSSPEVIRHFVEMRGIGIIDVKEIFGMGAVKDTESIDMIIHLEPWTEGKEYDRLGMLDEYTNIMGINVPSTTIPVKLGRNLAVIIEVAAMNNRQKRMGYNAAEELNRRLMTEMQKNTVEEI